MKKRPIADMRVSWTRPGKCRIATHEQKIQWADDESLSFGMGSVLDAARLRTAQRPQGRRCVRALRGGRRRQTRRGRPEDPRRPIHRAAVEAVRVSGSAVALRRDAPRPMDRRARTQPKRGRRRLPRTGRGIPASARVPASGTDGEDSFRPDARGWRSIGQRPSHSVREQQPGRPGVRIVGSGRVRRPQVRRDERTNPERQPLGHRSIRGERVARGGLPTDLRPPLGGMRCPPRVDTRAPRRGASPWRG